MIHLLLVSDGYARRMDEDRHIARLRPLPEREGGRAVDELPVPTRSDQQPFESERTEAPLAFGDVARIEWIERAKTPVAVRARDDGSGVVVDELHDVDRGLSRNRGYHLRSERIADHSSSNAGLGADILLQLEIGHVVIGDGRQATIIRHRVFADRYAPQRLGDAKRIITRTRCTVGMNVDDGH